jgi:hypothetical protein
MAFLSAEKKKKNEKKKKRKRKEKNLSPCSVLIHQETMRVYTGSLAMCLRKKKQVRLGI